VGQWIQSIRKQRSGTVMGIANFNPAIADKSKKT